MTFLPCPSSPNASEEEGWALGSIIIHGVTDGAHLAGVLCELTVRQCACLPLGIGYIPYACYRCHVHLNLPG